MTRGMNRGMIRGMSRGPTSGSCWQHLSARASTKSRFTHTRVAADSIHTSATVFACARHTIGIALLPTVTLGTCTVEISYEILEE